MVSVIEGVKIEITNTTKIKYFRELMLTEIVSRSNVKTIK
jgi:hypothetical protein